MSGSDLLRALALALLVATSAHAEDHLTLSLGVDYSSGNYGAPGSTEVFYIPLAAEYTRDRFVGKLTVPFLSIAYSQPGILVTGGPNAGLVRRPPPQQVVNTTSGIGDVILSGGYKIVNDHASGWYVTPTALVKFGTADAARGLGTGEADYSGQVDVAKVLGPWTPFGYLGYTVAGDPPGVQIDNSVYGRLGLDYSWAKDESAGAFLDLRQSTNRTVSGRAEATAYLMGPFDEVLKYELWLRAGFTSSVADFGGGASVKWSLW